MTGIERRTSRILAQDGRTLVFAFDHGVVGMHHAGLAKPEVTLREVVSAGADAILTTTGIAQRYGGILERTGLILNIDSTLNNEEAIVREAMLLGADMAKYMCFPGNEKLIETVERTKRLVLACHEWGLPLMIETIPVSFEAKEAHTPEKIGQAARIGCELGGDMIKMHYTGDPESFRRIVEALYAPVVVLGGAREGELRGLLQNVRDALDVGAAGVAIGRYIWEHKRPAQVISALGTLIHGNASVDQAMRELVTTI